MSNYYPIKEYGTNSIYDKIKIEHGFYFGDPCYVLKDGLYNKTWCGSFYNCADGVIYKVSDQKKLDGGWSFGEEYSPIMIVNHTDIGDCDVVGKSGQRYLVDSASLAIVPLENCDKKKLEKMKNDKVGMINESFSGIIHFSSDGIRFRITDMNGFEEVVDTPRHVE